MELSAIVYSTLAIVFFLILIIFVISYLGYKLKQKEGLVNSPTVINYPNVNYPDLRTPNTYQRERK